MPDAPVERTICMRCRRPMPACWCQDLPVVETGTRVVFVQHPKEARMKVGTARMAHLCLPNSELYVGAFWDDDPRLDPILSDTERPAVLLFPGPDAVDVLAGSLAGPVTLVVVDGTWSQAGKMVRRNPRLAALPRVAFTPPKASDYRIRREPRPECVSTIEALVHVLGALEGNPEGPMALLEPFRKMVDFQVDCATRMHCPRVRMRRRRG